MVADGGSLPESLSFWHGPATGETLFKIHNHFVHKYLRHSRRKFIVWYRHCPSEVGLILYQRDGPSSPPREGA